MVGEITLNMFNKLFRLGKFPSYIKDNPRGALSGIELTLFSRYSVGTNIFELDWDIAIILDTCRIDVLQQIKEEYDFINEVNQMSSVGAATPEWVCNTFSKDYVEKISETGYIAGNGFSEKILNKETSPEKLEAAAFAPTKWTVVSPEDFDLIDFVWRADEDSISTGKTGEYYSMADTVTDHAIAHWREREFEQMIVHYIEPHQPYLHTSLAEGKNNLGDIESSPFEYLRSGGEREKVWEMYKTELRAGLDAVETLIKNVEAERVLMTADHGEAFGEWNGYSHRSGSIHPHVRRVPVVWMSATDSKSRNPDVKFEYDVDESIEQHLTALGYKQ